MSRVSNSLEMKTLKIHFLSVSHASMEIVCVCVRICHSISWIVVKFLHLSFKCRTSVFATKTALYVPHLYCFINSLFFISILDYVLQ